MRKLSILGLVCLCLFSCKKEIKNPYSPEVVEPPIINHFTATHLSSNKFTLSWQVRNPATVEIDQGIGEVEAYGKMEVEILETTTYTLTATNVIGTKTASCVAELPERAGLEITTIPEVPVLHYYSGPAFDNSQGWVTIVIAETNGVGGHFDINFRFDFGSCTWPLYSQHIESFGILSILHGICADGRPTTMTIRLEGYDDNGFEIDVQKDFPVIIEN